LIPLFEPIWDYVRKIKKYFRTKKASMFGKKLLKYFFDFFTLNGQNKILEKDLK
jgi:hypothetical protein